MMLGKCVNVNYVPFGRTFTLRGWLFWYWCFNLKKDIHKMLPDGYCVGARLLGFEIQRIGRGYYRAENWREDIKND